MGATAPAKAALSGTERLLFALLWVPSALLAARFWWVCDDAYIAYRYAQNWARGAGLRFNLAADPPVEGYSDLLWVVLCAGFEKLGLDVAAWPAVLSFGAGAWLLVRVYRVLLGPLALDRAAAWLATAFLALSPIFLIWSTGGLETMPHALLLFWFFERLVLRPGTGSALTTGALGLALALIRIEGIYWVTLVVLVAASLDVLRQRAASDEARGAQCNGWPALAVAVGIPALGFGIAWALRRAHFGDAMANTATAKVALSEATLRRGWFYVVSLFLTVPSLFVVIPGALVGLARFIARRDLVAGAVVAFLGATTLYPVAVSGDFLPMGRMLVVGLPFYAIAAGWTFHAIGRAPGMRWPAVLLGAALVGIGLPAAFDAHVVPSSVREGFHFRGSEAKEKRTEYEQWVRLVDGTRSLSRRGRALARYIEPGDSMVTGAIGCVAYFSDIHVYDQNGLVTRRVAVRDTSDEPLRQPGHDKHVPETFFLDDEPTFMATGIAAAPDVHARLQRWATAGWSRYGYGPDFVALPDELAEPEDEGVPHYLVLLRRLAPGERARDVWQAKLQAADALRSEGASE